MRNALASTDLDSWHFTNATLHLCEKTKCVCTCKSSTSLHVSICVLVRVCGWAPCQSLSDSTASRWRIFVSETNGTERINYRHNVGDMPELLGGGGENKPFPCTPRFHPPTSLPPPTFPSPRPPMSTNGRLQTVTCPFSSRHQASVDHRREMAPIPDTPEKPQSHPVIREAEDPTSEAGRWRETHSSTQCGNTLQLSSLSIAAHAQWFNVSDLYTCCTLLLICSVCF